MNHQPDVRSQLKVRTTDWGEVLRLDVNQLGAQVPDDLPEQDRQAWAAAQNASMCQTLAELAATHGGEFSSFAEWTVTTGALYDGGDMRTRRKERFNHGYRAAITTLPWLDPANRWGGRLQATAYIPKTIDASFSQSLWQPKALYDTEFMALAPAVVTNLTNARLLYISGVVAWDRDIKPLFAADPRRQIRHVLEVLGAIIEEAGGTLSDIVRLRPFAHSPEIAAIIREEVLDLWRGQIPPTLLVADGVDFGNPPQLHTEIQVMGLLANDAQKVIHRQIEPVGITGADAALVIRTSRTRDFELLQAGEIRSQSNIAPDKEAVHVLQTMVAVLNLANFFPQEICLALVYAGSARVAELFGKLAGNVFPREAIHIVPCKPMREMGKRQLKVELTARRSVKR